MKINIPDVPRRALEILKENGHSAYLVGGCVRDNLRDAPSSDYDIATSAEPQETKDAFRGYRLIETGLKHGTVTVLIESEPVEITTFRTEGAYEAHRRPKEVFFTRLLSDDLSRRDFTVNAMAYSPESGITDLFGGQRDLEGRVIRAVGDPDTRFREDALRILRALRFASTLDFEIEAETAASVRRNAFLLRDISAERINAELGKLLLGDGCERILTQFASVIFEILPELAPTLGFEQRNPHHIYDVYTHTVKCVSACPRDKTVRMAALLHDVGKPATFSLGADGTGHFYRHSDESLRLAENALSRLRFDNTSQKEILTLIRYHDPVIEQTEAAVGRWLRRLGAETLSRLLYLKAADNTAQAPECHARLQAYEHIRGIMAEMLEKEACFSLKALAVNGSDLINCAGFTAGKQLGEMLSLLLDKVISGELPNQRETLLRFASEQRAEKE